MDDKVLEQIRFHQDVVAKDANSPLFQIREKEMEISGRVLAARNQADKIVSEARSKAAAIVKNASSDAERIAKERADLMVAETDSAVAEVGVQGVKDVAALEKTLEERRSQAADFVVGLVTAV
ncbi:MAG TPA: V-type ATPase subunit subunit G family protein [Coriobacteriia bacterium]|nr:V-type ATPase subunit subunit G family protein [Coriobacteriia bacterium]